MTIRSDDATTRTLDKQEAVRHLIHTAIRLIMDMEDPFAVHVLVQSADKLLIDMAKAKGHKLRLDWEDYIKPEYHKAFFAKHRAIYNYFKHADKDFDDDLPIHDIMRLNVMALFICVVNYRELFGEMTHHMVLHLAFTLTLSPELVNPPGIEETGMGAELLKGFQAIHTVNTLTPNEVFSLVKRSPQTMPKYLRERAEDCKDGVDFYYLSFSELREGKTKSNRIFRLPDYS